MNWTGNVTSRVITSGSPWVRLSSVALTPPSTEFSIGTRTAVTSPSRTASRASPTVAYGIGSTPIAGKVISA